MAEHGRFGHPAHLHLAWLLLEEHPALEALAIFNAGLLAMAARLNLNDKYNATLTTAFFFLVLERREPARPGRCSPPGMPICSTGSSANAFSAHFMTDETLSSEAARQNFVMPDVPAHLTLSPALRHTARSVDPQE